MRLFHSVNSLVVSWNFWLILSSKILLFLNFVKHTSKNVLKFYEFQMCADFFSSLSGCWVFSNLVIFHQIKVAKQIWEPCCHLAAETGSWFPLIVHIPSTKLAPINRNQGILKGEVSLYWWPPVRLICNQLYDYWQFLFLFAKQTNPNQSNRRSIVQWYFPLQYSLQKHNLSRHFDQLMLLLYFGKLTFEQLTFSQMT